MLLIHSEVPGETGHVQEELRIDGGEIPGGFRLVLEDVRSEEQSRCR